MIDKQTGYPSIDKPWLKQYREEAMYAPLPKCTLYEYAWENNKNDLSDVAFRYFGTRITYGEFFENSKLAAKSFSAMGVKQGDVVTIMSMHTPETIYAIYGLNYIGAVANMIYMTLSSNEILHTIAETESKLLVVLDVAAEKIDALRSKLNIPVVMLSVADSMPVYMKILYRLKKKKINNYKQWKHFLLAGRDTELPTISTDHESMAVIVYTSGTTGEPKGVMLSDDAMNALVYQDINGIITFERGLSILYMLPPFIGFGISHLHLIICAGLESILQIQIDPKAVTESFYKFLPQCFLTGPAFVDSILNYEKNDVDLSGLRYFVGGGGEIAKEKELQINEFLRSHGSKAKYSSGYGLTEASSVLCTNCNDISKVGSAGIPFIRTVVKVVDIDTDTEVKYGEEGELHFSAPNMMLGYYHNEDATDAVIYTDKNGERWLKTGDIGYVDEDGFVFVTGRLKRIVFTKADDGFSYKLFPQRIEELFQNDSSVENCGVVVRKDEERLNVAVAFVSINGKQSPEEQENIRKQLFEKAKHDLPEHEQPAEIIIIDNIPLTPSGKIDYRLLEHESSRRV